jgi:hypothetical protein
MVVIPGAGFDGVGVGVGVGIGVGVGVGVGVVVAVCVEVAEPEPQPVLAAHKAAASNTKIVPGPHFSLVTCMVILQSMFFSDLTETCYPASFAAFTFSGSGLRRGPR